MSKQNNNGTIQNQNNQNGVKPVEKKEDLTMKMMNFKYRHPRLCKVGKFVGGAFIGIGSAMGIYAGVDTVRRRTKKYHEIGALDILPDPGEPVSNLMDDEEPKASASEVLADEIEASF